MSEPHDDFVLSFFFHDVELSREDFGNDLRDSVAYQIALVNNTRCIDKEAALELLRDFAGVIINQVAAHISSAVEADGTANARKALLRILAGGPKSAEEIRYHLTPALEGLLGEMEGEGLVTSAPHTNFARVRVGSLYSITPKGVIRK